MKLSNLCLVLLFLGINFGEHDSFSDENNERPYSINLEILGRGLLYSANFDALVSEQVALGVGFSGQSISGDGGSGSLFIFPVYGNYYFSPGSSHGFLTGGLDLLLATKNVGGNGVFIGSGVVPVFGGGFEYRGEGGFLFRAAPYAMLGHGVLIWFGLSFGYAF